MLIIDTYCLKISMLWFYKAILYNLIAFTLESASPLAFQAKKNENN